MSTTRYEPSGPRVGDRPRCTGRRSFPYDPNEPLERQRWRSARDAVRDVFELAVAALTPGVTLSVAR